MTTDESQPTPPWAPPAHIETSPHSVPGPYLLLSPEMQALIDRAVGQATEPLRSEIDSLRRSIGAMALVHGELGESHDSMVLIHAEEMGARIEAENLAMRAMTEVNIEPLTGLSTRKAWLLELKGAVNEVRENGGSLTVYFADLDNLKMANEGKNKHVGGDRAIKAGARALEGVHHRGKIARFGGDEFVVFEHKTADELEKAREIASQFEATGDLHDRRAIEPQSQAENMHRRVNEIFWELINNDPDNDDLRSLPLGISIAAVTLDPTSDDDAEALIARADTLMFEKKIEALEARVADRNILAARAMLPQALVQYQDGIYGRDLHHVRHVASMPLSTEFDMSKEL